MPYVDFSIRQSHAALGSLIASADITTSGELNFLLTSLVERYRLLHGDEYETFNAIVGALDNAKDEFRRRVQHPYEDRKARLNGDVYRPVRLTPLREAQ